MFIQSSFWTGAAMNKTGLAQPYDKSRPLGLKPTHGFRFVMTERRAHEAWGRLALKHPVASATLHQIISLMGHQNALIISQDVLSQMIGVSLRSISRAISTLVTERWIDVVQVGKGTTRAYVVNAAVAWGEKRENKRFAHFTASVFADLDEQDPALKSPGDLRKIPSLYLDEHQLPSGDGEPPPSQPHIEGLEPDLPARKIVINEKMVMKAIEEADETVEPWDGKEDED